MTVGELCSRISSSEITEWQEVYRQDPWDRNRTDFMLAQIAAVLFNSWRGQNTPAKNTTEFMPYYREEREERPVSEQIARLKAALPDRKSNGG